MAVKDLDPKEPIVLTDKSAMLRRLVPSLEGYLESPNKQAQDRLQDCLNRFPDTSKAAFPFSTDGTGKRVTEHLKQNGYNWVHIEDIFPFDEDIDYKYEEGRINRKGFARTTVKRRLNHLHSQMKLKGLRTFKSQTYVQWFGESNRTLQNQLYEVGTLKYDLEDSTVHELKRSHQRVTVDNYQENATINSVSEPMFLLLGPSAWDLTLKDENDDDVKKYDSDGRHISWETREPLPNEFRLVAIPHTKNKPFVINQQQPARGMSHSTSSKIAVNLDGAEWGFRQTKPRDTMQQYSTQRFDWNKAVEEEKDTELPISDANKYGGGWDDIISRILLHNKNYNHISMNDSHPQVNSKKNQMDLINHDDKLYKHSALAEQGMIRWGSSNRSQLVLYGIMMKADEKSERELFLKTQGLGIVNFSNPI